jgi:AraC-like DNA-binding protein
MGNFHINDGWLDTTSTIEREILDFRREGFGPLLTLGRFHYDSATEPLADQQHDDWLVLVFALNGAQHYQLGTSRILLSSGQVMRIPPGTRYGSGPWPEQRGAVAWMILDTGPAWEWSEMGIGKQVAAALLESLTNPGGAVVFPQPGMTGEMLNGLFVEWAMRDVPLRRELIRHRLSALLLSLAVAMDDAEKPLHGRTGPAAARIREVMQWLGENVQRKIRVEDLALRARLPQARLIREFRSLTGFTPKDFILRLKVEEAARMLERDPTLPVTAIAHELGFSSSQYFATVFRRYLRVSPVEYRSGNVAGSCPQAPGGSGGGHVRG